ncbi:MAG: hypothetical protein ACYDAZ_00815 [Thermoplasmataceae archaeon]
MKQVLESGDNAVAVVIGALLTFVIVTSLLGAFILWYVPSNGQQQDMKYISEVENSFFRLQDKIDNSTPFPNEFVIQSFPLGIPGTPPFSTSTDSNIMYKNQGGFNSSLNFSMIVNVTYSGVHRSISINVDFNATGMISIETQTPFVTPTNFYFQNNVIISSQPSSNYSQITGPLPLSVTNSSGIFINSSQFGIVGQNQTITDYGSNLLTMQYSEVNLSDFSVGENVTVSNLTGGYTTAVVNSILLKSFYYNVSSPYIQAWNKTFASIYNTTGKTLGNSSVGISWNFTDFQFMKVFLLGNSMSIHTTAPLKPFSVGISYFTLKLLRL